MAIDNGQLYDDNDCDLVGQQLYSINDNFILQNLSEFIKKSFHKLVEKWKINQHMYNGMCECMHEMVIRKKSMPNVH